MVVSGPQAKRLSGMISKGYKVMTNAKILEKEPMAQLGFGIVSYMQMMQYL